jgi:hypothetical protein
VATYFVQVDYLGGDSPGLTRTQNVAPGDTIIVDFRGYGPEDFNPGTNVNCSVTENGNSPVLSGGTRFTVNNFSGSSHSSQYSDDEGDSWTLSGSVQVPLEDIGIASGTISLLNLQNFFGGSNPASLSEYYRGGGLVPNITENSAIPTSGTISLSNFYNSKRIP